MAQTRSQKRPWLAALLAAFFTGLGHLYLRRWRRAIGWVVVSVGVSVLLVDPAAVDAFAGGNWDAETLLAVAPTVLVAGCSIVDAYLLARVRTRTRNATVDATEPSDEDAIACPHCGKDLDPELDFCHWCTNPIADVDRDRVAVSNGNGNGNGNENEGEDGD